MWQHQPGRIDFDGPLSLLLQLGWGFREIAPIVGVRGGGHWAVTGIQGARRLQVDRTDRRDAWAEAVRLALLPALFSEPPARTPDDPTVCDEERARLRADGWCFSEHPTAQVSGRDGWVVSGTRGARTIHAVDDHRSDAWAEALILAVVLGPAASGGASQRPPSDRVE